jgi:transposase
MRRQRKQYTPLEKVAILRRHLVEKVSLSQICEEYDLKPTVYYRWQKQFFEQGATVFQTARNGEVSRLRRQVAALEEKVTRKNEVVAELMDEYVALKKALGAP